MRRSPLRRSSRLRGPAGSPRRGRTRARSGPAAAALTTYSYDLNGNQAGETDADHNPTSYTYDALGHVLTTTTPLGTTTSLYDQAGNKVWQEDADGRATAPVLERVKPVGYHAWIDARTLVLSGQVRPIR